MYDTYSPSLPYESTLSATIVKLAGKYTGNYLYFQSTRENVTVQD